MPLPPIEYLIVGLMTAGVGGIFLWHDGSNRASRALSLCLIMIGLRLFAAGHDLEDGQYRGQWLVAALSDSLEALAIFFGVEWGRRIGLNCPPGLRASSARTLFRVSQLLIFIYWGLSLGYLAIFPEQAATDLAGTVRVRGAEFAVFAPILGTSILLSGIGISLLRFSGIDRAEIIRLNALSIAGPFLLLALIFGGWIVPVTLSLGLLVFLSGSVAYLIVQSRRGEFMRQFLSPEVARLAQHKGVEQALAPQRRVLSVVVCDLRGFTQYARQRDTDAVFSLLERFYAIVGEVTQRHGGTIKDHAGDGVLILVGAPARFDDHAQRALALACELQREAADWLSASTPPLGLGVGVATGHVTVGAIRAARRREYVAVGNPVNLASRLCDRARHGEVLSDTRTLEAIAAPERPQSQQREPEPLKGFAEPIPVQALLPLAAN